ncbi:trypsin-like peptidase domain-containing protein [Reichenbachiella carrageenanivorans]|uniref:Trypsin-like peptidase domain-containing protein n=1 Tax=Reichenbachiella carrageenanivorans TaxID=2979869 RepID=A0ABY6CW97_9BACT|nr:trypsin-like peptidase domain-containing protein [Reichenbachiella carrageenanivorans]UXX78191.1 trypsin-like peptidase domain-containing protein [Reichenbachiella carrageenanivorans]
MKMKNKWTLIALLLVSQLGHAQSLSEWYQQLSPSVVKVIISEKEIRPQDGQMVDAQGIGSGVLISDEGLVLTASHVVQTADNIKVQFNDGETIPAHVVASATYADVATIKLSWLPKGKHPVKLGNSDSTKVGDEIFMIGSPYGLDYSLSVGYISGRHIKNKFAHGQPAIEFFQTDAAINHGNSGGPMFNMKGEVIGVASFILSESGGFQGLGFAATSNVCQALLLDSPTPWTGMVAVMVAGELASALNIPQGAGLLIQKVTLFSPLGMIGVKGGNIPLEIAGESVVIGGDVILSINGIPLSNETNLERARESFADLTPGDSFVITVWRGGEREKLKGKFGDN